MMSAADIFARLTFERPDCGDCCKHSLASRRILSYLPAVIMAMVNASGPRGLSAFLPDRQSLYKPTIKSPTQRSDRPYDQSPILPLTNTWQAADFSLDSVLQKYPVEKGGIALRSWTLRLLSRYLYVTGESTGSIT